MQTGITITLSQDVPPGGGVDAVEAELLLALADAAKALTDFRGEIVDPPAPYKTGLDGEYRKMRDGEGYDQYTEVRVRARVEEVE